MQDYRTCRSTALDHFQGPRMSSKSHSLSVSPGTVLSVLCLLLYSARMIHFGYFSFSTIHLELKRQIRFYTVPWFPLKSHTRFKTIMVKIYTRFQTKTARKPYPFWAAHTYIAYIGEYSPPLREKIAMR